MIGYMVPEDATHTKEKLRLMCQAELLALPGVLLFGICSVRRVMQPCTESPLFCILEAEGIRKPQESASSIIWL